MSVVNVCVRVRVCIVDVRERESGSFYAFDREGI